MLEMTLSGTVIPLKDQVTITKDLLTIIGILIAFLWFFYRWEHGRRAQIDLDCEFFTVKAPNVIVAEIKLSVENKGLVKQHIQVFSLSVQELETPINSDSVLKTEWLEFSKALINEKKFEKPESSVRPGVKQLFTYPILLKTYSPIIQVTAALIYSSSEEPINQVQRIFQIKTSENIEIPKAV
ncbi:MAG TPA: hypothetical protein VF556_13140 [Pyrinomonadaceae bacterium]|jgi:hypothetical protein